LCPLPKIRAHSFHRAEKSTAFDLLMALGGWLPAACRGIYLCSGWFLPEAV
jgi:hypothetical protein